MEKTRFHFQALGLALKGIFSTPGQACRGQSGATPMPMYYPCSPFLCLLKLVLSGKVAQPHPPCYGCMSLLLALHQCWETSLHSEMKKGFDLIENRSFFFAVHILSWVTSLCFFHTAELNSGQAKGNG